MGWESQIQRGNGGREDEKERCKDRIERRKGRKGGGRDVKARREEGRKKENDEGGTEGRGRKDRKQGEKRRREGRKRGKGGREGRTYRKIQG